MTTSTPATAAAALSDPAFRELATGATVSFALESGTWQAAIALEDGHPAPPGEPGFTIRMDDTEWDKLLDPGPEAGSHHIVSMIRDRRAALDGDSLCFAQHLQLVRRTVELMRPSPAGAPVVPGRELSLRGAYIRLELPGWGVCDVYAERAGTGLPLLCLATAGSDSRQYHGLVTQTDLTDEFEVIAVDLPWHGKSNPAWGRRSTEYTLDSQQYTAFVAAATDALGIDRPILVGSSMAGAAVVEAVARHPGRFRGAVACQVGPRVAGRRTPWLRSSQVNQSLHVPEWTYGLMSPQSPDCMRDRVWWGYSQGGYGAYDADIGYYTQHWDIDSVAPLLTAETPHIAVLSGAYDTSVPPAASRELASRIPNASFTEMPELGHFPHAENPEVFVGYLRQGIHKILHSDPAPTS